MVKMAHASLPNIICKPINTTRMCPTDFNTTISDVLQSEPVKRLFNQPNIIIKAIPIKIETSSASNKNVPVNKTNNIGSNLSKPKQSELSVIPLQIDQEGNIEDENLLPSKKQGKSEITLVPIKKEKKPCGHYESCENIVCDVAVQQYADHDGLSPMLAFNIEDNEISAPVSKHCANAKCDALSIDHDRCRRAVIRLNRCNQSTACDICGIALKTQRSRVHHKNCKRRTEYRHNEINGAQILKERMREREIQMIEASKAKKNDYMDPVTGYNLAMETLKNNEELIIIPKSVPQQQQQQQQQQPTISITSVSTNQSTLQINNGRNVFGKFLPTFPIVVPQQSIVLGKTQCFNENSITAPIQVALSNSLNGPLITTSSTVPQSPYVTFTAQSNTHQIQVNDLLLPQSQIVTTPIQPKPLLTPIRVVPITNLITQPSLLHQIQGIPKFCIMPDNTVPPLTITSPQPIQPATPVPKVDIPSEQIEATPQKKKKEKSKKKRKLKKKDLKCNYCLKSFSTDWYFKMHVAMHEGEKRFCCKICYQTCSNRYDLKTHMLEEHKKESIPSTPSICDQQATENSRKCLDCNVIYASVDHLSHHREKCHETVAVEGKVKVPSNVIEAKVNLDLHQEVEKEDNKTNGYVCLPNQDIVTKTELCHEV